MIRVVIKKPPFEEILTSQAGQNNPSKSCLSAGGLAGCAWEGGWSCLWPDSPINQPYTNLATLATLAAVCGLIHPINQPYTNLPATHWLTSPVSKVAAFENQLLQIIILVVKKTSWSCLDLGVWH